MSAWPPKLPRRALFAVAKSKPDVADAARCLSREVRKFARIDRDYKGDTFSWFCAYEDALDTAEHLLKCIGRPASEHECALRNWARMVFPSKADMARMPWTPIEGLSPNFAFLQALLAAALMRAALASVPFRRMTRGGRRNPCGDDQIKIGEILRCAEFRAHNIAYHIIWREIEVNVADRLLMRRAIELRCRDARVFHLQYRRALHGRTQERRLRADGQQTSELEWLRALQADDDNPLSQFLLLERARKLLTIRYLHK